MGRVVLWAAHYALKLSLIVIVRKPLPSLRYYRVVFLPIVPALPQGGLDLAEFP